MDFLLQTDASQIVVPYRRFDAPEEVNRSDLRIEREIAPYVVGFLEDILPPKKSGDSSLSFESFVLSDPPLGIQLNQLAVDYINIFFTFAAPRIFNARQFDLQIHRYVSDEERNFAIIAKAMEKTLLAHQPDAPSYARLALMQMHTFADFWSIPLLFKFTAESLAQRALEDLDYFACVSPSKTPWLGMPRECATCGSKQPKGACGMCGSNDVYCSAKCFSKVHVHSRFVCPRNLGTGGLVSVNLFLPGSSNPHVGFTQGEMLAILIQFPPQYWLYALVVRRLTKEKDKQDFFADLSNTQANIPQEVKELIDDLPDHVRDYVCPNSITEDERSFVALLKLMDNVINNEFEMENITTITEFDIDQLLPRNAPWAMEQWALATWNPAFPKRYPRGLRDEIFKRSIEQGDTLTLAFLLKHGPRFAPLRDVTFQQLLDKVRERGDPDGTIALLEADARNRKPVPKPMIR